MSEPRLPAALSRWPKGVHLYLDAAVAVVATTAYVSFTYIPSTVVQPGFEGPKWLGWLVACAVGLPLAVRRRWPVPVLAVVLAATMAATFLHMILEPYLAVSFALYLVAVARPLRISGFVLGVTLAGCAGAILLGQPWAARSGNLAFAWVCLGGAWVLGKVIRDRRAWVARDAERQAQQALTDQRLRIARELHDVVAHGMSLIAVKASVANHIATQRPGEAADALRVIERASREALTEMRHILGVLRSDRDLDAELAPSPGLAGLAELAGQAESAGVRVRLDVRGEAELPEGLELSVYRIVQEALTNVVKHAAPARCAVLVELGGDGVRIEVTDDGPGRRMLPGEHQGHGLIGMRERVAVYDGSFAAGPGQDGGFVVSATLPLAERKGS